MIILIAEAKTMEAVEMSYSPQEIAGHRPAGDALASEVMERIASMEVGDIARVVKISSKMAVSLKQMAYEFPNKSLGLRAIEAFTGVVFKHLDFKSLTDSAKVACKEDVRIVSSLYGYLRADDIIKPYRMEYTTELGPDDEPMCKALKAEVTAQFLGELASRGENEILNLLPADAAKCIDWAEVKKVAKVAKVDFRDTSGETISSPHAGKLKAFRGRLLRNILINNLKSLEQVAAFRSDEMIPTEGATCEDISFYI